MIFTSEVCVVVDELLTEVLRCQLSPEQEVIALETIVDDLLNAQEWGKVDQGLSKSIARRVLTRSPAPFRKDLYDKAYSNGEPPSKGTKGMRHKVVVAFAESAYSQLKTDLSGSTEALTRAATNSRRRTTNTEYRRFFKVLMNRHYKCGGDITDTLVAAVGGRPKEIPAEAVVSSYGSEDYALSLEENEEAEKLESKEDLPIIERVESPPTDQPVRPMVQLPLAASLQTAKDDDDADFLDSLYLPTFDDFKGVFSQRYPFVKLVSYEGTPHLGVGYLSGRLPQKGTLFRCNCAVEYWDEYGESLPETHFRKLMGICEPLQYREGETRKFIKILPLKVGMTIRYWTNLREKKDMPEKHRYILIDDTFSINVFTDREEMRKARAALRIALTARGLLKKKKE